MNVGKACIVVSTQVVEVSLDINFDLMVTNVRHWMHCFSAWEESTG
ncbi:MAG: hypothetical protein ACLR5I_01095 [Odoribacter splanchnicus]